MVKEKRTEIINVRVPEKLKDAINELNRLQNLNGSVNSLSDTTIFVLQKIYSEIENIKKTSVKLF